MLIVIVTLGENAFDSSAFVSLLPGLWRQHAPQQASWVSWVASCHVIASEEMTPATTKTYERFRSLRLHDFRKFYSRGSGEFPPQGSSLYLLPLTVFSVNCENFWNALFIKEINVGGYDTCSEGAVDAATEQPLTRKQHLKKKMDFKSKGKSHIRLRQHLRFSGLGDRHVKERPLEAAFLVWPEL